MIRTTDDGGLRVMTTDRPARRNALRPTDLDALEAVVTGADTPVVLLRRSDPTFCADADLDSVANLSNPEAFAKHGQHVANAVESAKSVAVVGIDGAACGGDVGLAFACDAQVATPRAILGEPGVRLNLFGAWSGTVRLPRVVGEGHALRSSLSGRIVNADEALRMGLAFRIVDDPGEVVASAIDDDRRSLRVVKERLRDRGNRDRRLEREAADFAELHRANADSVAASHEK